MKKILTIISICFLMFMLGRITYTINVDSTNISGDTMSTSYVIEGNYINDNIDFESEAIHIKKTTNSNMSTSKIKHLLIYIDGLCQHYDLNYNLVKSVISTESNWKYNAKSSAGALGLMQIMRACATDYKTPHSEMYDPYVNVTIGIKYLDKLNNRFEDTQTALVAYNEGPRHAAKYRREYIDNSKYVNKVVGYLLSFEPIGELAYND